MLFFGKVREQFGQKIREDGRKCASDVIEKRSAKLIIFHVIHSETFMEFLKEKNREIQAGLNAPVYYIFD
jgi:hypothetical protein